MVVRWSALIAALDDGDRHVGARALARARPAVSGGSVLTPMSTTIVPPRPARCSQFVVGERRVAGDDREQVADAAVREGDAGRRGHRDRARDARDDRRPGTPARVAGEHLLAAAPEDVRVAALEAHDVAIRRGRARRAAARCRSCEIGDGPGVLPTSTSSGVGGELGEAVVGCEPVVEHDVGVREGLDGADGEQVLASRVRRRRG